MNMEVSLAEILGIENEYDLLNKQAKVCKEAMALTDKHHYQILLNPAIMHHRTGKLQNDKPKNKQDETRKHH